MSDSLSHSCPTCDGTGYDPHSRMANRRPCPDCIDGYPKAAVERVAMAIEAEAKKWPVAPNYQGPGVYRLGASMEELALAAIRAFHNEGSE